MVSKRTHISCLKKPRLPYRGFTIIELVVVILILSVVSVGTVGYHYFGTRMSLHADAEITATRTARLILDNWKKTGGSEDFNLEDLDMGFTQTKDENQYRITVNQLPLTVQLDWNDVETDALAGVGLRRLDITVRWRQDYTDGEVADTDPTYIMTTYVRRDESEG